MILGIQPLMIDLHSHILPGIDDGAASVAASLQMARIAVDDGIQHMACTPHVVTGLYENSKSDILAHIADLQRHLDAQGLALKLYSGADVHLDANLEERLRVTIPTLNGSRYFLLEPPHAVLPPNLPAYMRRLVDHGFVPIITHPERLAWVKNHYEVLEDINDAGCLIQLTAASITGRFGETAKKLCFQLLEDGRVDILATDTHDPVDRLPILSHARDVVTTMLGQSAAEEMVEERPHMILANEEFLSAAKRTRKSRPRNRLTGSTPLPRWVYKLRKWMS